MEENIKKLNNEKMLNDFNAKKEIKNNYRNVLKWYNENVKNIQSIKEATPQKTEIEAKSEEE